MAMDCRKVRVLKLISETKRLVLAGRPKEALENIHKKENILEPKEREKVMNVFTTSVMKYNENIEWDDICHS
ncbi:MAG TPA: hypothetical protein PLI02_00820 [Candidatus Pacearchaeota archaeon]|jgi:hypothetical protein|nr:hypothetical protein [Candidatus Pacearchaeota archaeon]HRT18083.1 hypothetical protein [Candidatus Paceibacterota bacterium]